MVIMSWTKEKQKEYFKLYRLKHKDQIKQYMTAYYAKNRQKLNAYKIQYNKDNPINRRARFARYRAKHSDKVNYWAAKRRAYQLQATPKWLTLQQLNAIQEWYTLAKELQWLSQEPLEVDHIIPLQGDNVCGLHVPWNLQILPRSANASKSNKL